MEWGGTRALYDTCLAQIENRTFPVCEPDFYIFSQNIHPTPTEVTVTLSSLPSTSAT